MTAPSPAELLAAAERLADDVLFPAAVSVDRGGVVPVAGLDALAAAGLYGASLQGNVAVTALIETLSSGCLTTAFVWAQHLGAAAAASASDGPVNELTPRLASGELRAGVAFAHMLRPDPPLTTAVPVDGGWTISGTAPWVTGWGHIDLVHVAARHGDDIVWALIDAVDAPTLVSSRYDLAAIQASQTVELSFDSHVVPADRVTRIDNYEAWKANYRLGLRNNGSFPLGVARRCCALLDVESFNRELEQRRRDLDASSPETVSIARAEAALFAVRASTALVATSGGRAVAMDHDAQRLHREAMFLMVQGQTPAIRQLELERLGNG